MNTKAFIVILVFLIWTQLSWRWYTSGIKGFYTESSKNMYAGPGPHQDAHNEELKLDVSTVESGKRLTIFFPYKSTNELSDDSFKRDIQAFCASIEDNSGQISVTGHTDQKGSEAYNLTLGLERAKYVSERLIEQGVSPEQIKVRSRGETQPYTHDGLAMPSKDRRVEIELEY